MKFISMRSALALALALALASCGGGKAAFTVGGTVTNLKYTGLVLTTNGMETKVAPPAKAGDDTSFSFPKQVEYGDVYDVAVKTNPDHQSCAPTPGTRSDTAGRLAQINVYVQCVVNSYSIGGTVTGLTADGLVLANGSAASPATVPKGATSFAFPEAVLYGDSFGVTVLTQPAGLVCSVTNGTRVMADAKVEDIVVACVPAPAP